MKTILVLTDFSERAECATELALKLAEKTNSDILLYNAFPVSELTPVMPTIYPYYENLDEFKIENLNRLKEFGRTATEKVYGNSEIWETPQIACAQEIGTIGQNIKTLLSNRTDIWLIVMGDKNEDESNFNRFLFGSDTGDIIKKSTLPVLLVPTKSSKKSIESIVFATDLEDGSHKAHTTLTYLARIFDAKVVVLYVSDHRLTLAEKLKNQEIFNKMTLKSNYSNISFENVVGYDIGQALVKYVEKQNIDLLAMIHRKHSFFERVIHSSNTIQMTDYHNIPLLVFPADT